MNARVRHRLSCVNDSDSRITIVFCWMCVGISVLELWVRPRLSLRLCVWAWGGCAACERGRISTQHLLNESSVWIHPPCCGRLACSLLPCSLPFPCWKSCAYFGNAWRNKEGRVSLFESRWRMERKWQYFKVELSRVSPRLCLLYGTLFETEYLKRGTESDVTARSC